MIIFTALYTGFFAPTYLSGQDNPYILEWGSTMSQYLINGYVAFPDQEDGSMTNFPLHVRVFKKGTRVGVHGIKVNISVAPGNGLIINRGKPVTDPNGTAQMRGRFPTAWGPKAGDNCITISAHGAGNKLHAFLYGIPGKQDKPLIYVTIDPETIDLTKEKKALVLARAVIPNNAIFPQSYKIQVQIMGTNQSRTTITPSKTGRFYFNIQAPDKPGTIYFTITIQDDQNEDIAVRQSEVIVK
jgi:hypothetical protein